MTTALLSKCHHGTYTMTCIECSDEEAEQDMNTCTPERHVFHAASANHPNILSGMNQPWGSDCLCGATQWSGHNPRTDGREEIEPFIRKQCEEISWLVKKMI